MKRIDIYIAVGVFLILLGVYEFNLIRGIENELIKTFCIGTFSALLVLFQQRARMDTHIDDSKIEIRPSKDSP